MAAVFPSRPFLSSKATTMFTFNLRKMCFIFIVFLHCFVVSSSFKVFTEQSVTAVKGGNVSLPCNFTGNPTIVWWWRHNSTGATDDDAKLVAREYKGNVEGVGIDRFNITKSENDYRLTIRNVSLLDETTYSCQVELDNHKDERGYTNLNVIALAKPMEPVIKLCHVTTPGHCTYFINKDPPEHVNLVCELHQVRPAANLTWIKIDGKLREIPPPLVEERSGLYTVSSTLQIPRSEFDHQYKCEARGEAVNGVSSMTASFGTKGLHWGYIVLIIFAIVILGVIFTWFYHRRFGIPCLSQDGAGPAYQPPVYRVPSTCSNEVQSLRSEIRKYSHGSLTDKVLAEGIAYPNAPIRMAIVGLTGAGKSSFIRSLKYAFSGVYSKEIEVVAGSSAGGVTLEPTFYEITDKIHIQDNKGMRDLNINKTKKIMTNIKEQVISLLIFVIRPSDVQTDVEAVTKFLIKLSKAVRTEFATYPMVIVTHRDKIPDQTTKEVIRDKLVNMDIIQDKIIFVENFTEKPKDKSNSEDLVEEFLTTLYTMLTMADGNLVQQLNKTQSLAE
ncbi:uncharacterized protein LOC121420419 [Lytechinus variegatus]|uniref:uncharacterized protein LOC121420419 n=1 Tax=Lytechinus variegatus TaxID=7654 RepID=UPI001BB1FA06|nr:uncharacterized protein LOC121420419 [Lytechinus variegatus]